MDIDSTALGSNKTFRENINQYLDMIMIREYLQTFHTNIGVTVGGLRFCK